MWFIIVKYSDGMDIVKQTFESKSEAEVHMKKIAQIDGPKYAIAHSYHWAQLTSNPSWETYEV